MLTAPLHLGTKAPKRPLERPATTIYRLTPVAALTDSVSRDGGAYPSRRLKKDEIRLLELRPGRYGQPIHCKINIYQLIESNAGDHPDWPELCGFEALSYTWGPSLEGHCIRLNGCVDLLVTDNLWYAMQRLRWAYFTRHLWIDAIVINQKDDVEKRLQVRRMMTIYKCAKRTLVWLGEPTRPALSRRESKIHTPEFVHKEYAKAPERCARSRGYQDGYYPAPLVRYTVGLPIHTWDVLTRRRDIGTFRDLEAALASTDVHWYTRTWIVQEFAAGRNVQFMIGSRLLEVEEFDPELNFYAKQVFEKMRGLSDHTSKLLSNFESLKEIGPVDRRDPRKENFMNVMYHLRSFESTDPRDRVYGVLGLMNDRHANLIEVDYGMPPGLVFAQATFSQIEIAGTLNILTQVRINRADDLGLPSWAFDCQMKGDLVPFPMYSIRYQSPLTNLQVNRISVALDESWRYLTLKGRVLDRVFSSEDLTEQPVSHDPGDRRQDDLPEEQLELYQELLRERGRFFPSLAPKPEGTSIAHNTGEYTHLASLAGLDPLYRGGNDPAVYATGQLPDDPNARIALCFPECDLGTTHHQESLRRIDEVLLKHSAGAESSKAGMRTPMKTEILQTLYAYAVTVSGAQAASAFTSASLGLAGFGPAGMQEGDSIVLLRRCRLPVTLRPADKEGTWLFRGFVYVHGIVDCEYYSRQLKERGDIARKNPEMRFAIFPEFLKGEEEDVEFVLA